MIDLIAGYAKGYSQSHVRPFFKSLYESGYTGRVLFFADGGAAKEAEKWDADVRPCPPLKVKVHSDRFLCLEEAISEINCEGVLLTDTRDVIFQKDPSIALPSKGLHVFEEDKSMTLGSCPYNSEWLRLGYGGNILRNLGHFPISCVGTTCGDLLSVHHYLDNLRREIERIQPKTHKPQDQAAHNYLIRKKLKATVWDNEEGEAYTVGYIPRGSVKMVDDKIVNRVGKVPTVIHQWDRHKNLKNFVEGIL